MTRWAFCLGRTLALAAPLVLLVVALLPGPAQADKLKGQTYCVGPRGNPPACESSAILKQHRGSCWHDHGESVFGPGTAYTDGTHCYLCYDECDSTCDIIFLRDHPHWGAVNAAVCGIRIPWAPLSEGVKHHVIDGQSTKAPPPPPPPPVKKKVRLRPEVVARSQGPYAVGDDVELELSVRGPDGKRRGFGKGELVITDAGGKETRQSVDAGGKPRLRVKVPLAQQGAATVRFEPRADDIPLKSDEQLDGQPSGQALALEVAACKYRGRLIDPPAVSLPGKPLDVVVWVIDEVTGQPVSPSSYSGPPIDVSLQLDDAPLVTARAEAQGSEWKATLAVPEIEGDEVAGTLSASGQNAGGALCPEDPAALVVSQLGVSLSVSAPSRCYLTKPCSLSWTVSSPSSGPAADQARSFLSSARVEALLGAEPLEVRGSTASGELRVEIVPETVGSAFFRLSLSSGDERVESQASVEVREDIQLALPSVLDLGSLRGGMDWEETCVPLDFSAPGNRGALLTPFSVELEDPEDCDCAGEPTLAMTVLDPAAGDGGLWTQTAGEDAVTLPDLYLFEARGALLDNERLTAQEGKAGMVVCLSGLGRCPAAGDAPPRTLLIRPAVAEFADQVARVELRYSVESRSLIACYKDLIVTVLLSLLGLFVLYGFIRPHSFDLADRIRIAGDTRSLARAPKVPLREMPGGRRGWYRSARASVGSGGARLKSPRRAVFVLHATPQGPLLRTRARVSTQNPRNRRMEDVPVGKDGLLLRGATTYQIADMFVRMN